MKHNLAALALSPVLAYQAWRTRRSVPKLPEPPGSRCGEVGEGKVLKLLIVGDSAAAGVGAPNQGEALSGNLAKCLSGRFLLKWRLVAKTGATTSSTIRHLSRLNPEDFDIALTSLGVNDVTSMTRLNRWRREQSDLRQLLRKRFAVSLIVTSGLPPVHGFPALPQPLRWYLGSRATLFDHDLASVLEDERDCAFLSLRFTDNAAKMASDGFHPGPPVYAEWARRAGRIIEDRFGGKPV